jgi:NAD(P)-dependent dehydrogenase (short-subunit alcohol dehydrogenase family)
MARLDAEAMEALTELYIAYFNRAPDAVGLYFWGNQLADGMSLREIAGYFFDQPETRAMYGEVADLTDFVTAVYENVLGRAPDAVGLNFWLDLLENNAAVTPPTFIQEILAGAKAETGSPADAAYLANKVLLGGHFAVTRGMSDVDEARMVMADFDGSQISLAVGLARSDAFYEEALSSTDGDFLIELVGLAEDAFLF